MRYLGGLIRQVVVKHSEESRGPYKANGRITHSEVSRGAYKASGRKTQ